MALSTYDGLIAAVGDLLDRTDLAGAIPDFVTALEAEVNGKIRVRQMICRSRAVIGAEFERVPTNFAGVKTLHILTAPAGPLRFADSGEILRRKAESTAAGRPALFSVVGEEFQFYPAPDSAYEVELATYETLPPLAVHGSNWLLARYPNVYLYGAARHAAPYLRDDERLGVWTALFEEGLAAIRYADREETYGDRPAMRARRSF